MNKVITEDIIRKAINESIDEFMLEEAWGGMNGLKNWSNKWGLNNLGRGIRNWAANYMDKRTGGKWNAKYGIYDDNTYKSIRSENPLDYFNDLMTETKYLRTWFDTHAKNANDILNYKDGPTYSKYGKSNFFNSSVWMGVSGATQYIKTYCTYQNYLEYTQRYFTDYQGNEYIEGYINNEIQPLAEQPQKAIQKISFGAFNWSQYGKDFYNQSRQDRNEYLDKQQKENQYQATPVSMAKKERQTIVSFFNDLTQQYDAQANKNVDNLEFFMKYNLDKIFANYFSNYASDRMAYDRINLVKSYVNTMFKTLIKLQPKDIADKHFNYKEFLKSSEGREYAYLIKQYIQQANSK